MIFQKKKKKTDLTKPSPLKIAGRAAPGCTVVFPVRDFRRFLFGEFSSVLGVLVPRRTNARLSALCTLSHGLSLGHGIQIPRRFSVNCSSCWRRLALALALAVAAATTRRRRPQQQQQQHPWQTRSHHVVCLVVIIRLVILALIIVFVIVFVVVCVDQCDSRRGCWRHEFDPTARERNAGDLFRADDAGTAELVFFR